MKLAYLTNRYPSVSHTFIRREIAAVERAGFEVERISVRRSPHGFVDEADRDEAARTCVLLDHPASLIADTLALLATRPGRFLRAMRVALRSSVRTSPGLRHLVYLVEACGLVRLCAKRGIGHVHVHFGTNPAAVARLCRRLGGPSYSFTIHGPSEWIDPHGLELGAKSAEASFVACISHYTGAQLRRFCDPDHWHKIEIVRCGIDSRFLDDPPSPDPASMTLICVGRLCPEKAQLVLLDAFAALLDDHPSARLVLCGDGEMRPQVERRIDELGIAHAIEITGWVDSHEVHRRLSGARALVLPSFAEGLPVVIMEAFALARPAITTYIAGIPELVRDGHNGWLIPAGDHAALRDALASCLDADSQAIREMGDAAREAVIAQHHADTAARPLIRRLRSILGLPGVRAGADVATQSDGAELGQDRPDPVIGARGG